MLQDRVTRAAARIRPARGKTNRRCTGRDHRGQATAAATRWPSMDGLPGELRGRAALVFLGICRGRLSGDAECRPARGEGLDLPACHRQCGGEGVERRGVRALSGGVGFGDGPQYADVPLGDRQRPLVFSEQTERPGIIIEPGREFGSGGLRCVRVECWSCVDRGPDGAIVCAHPSRIKGQARPCTR